MSFDAVGGTTGALGGAASGAKVGALFGPVGAGVGAVVGGLAGLFTGGKKNKVEAKPLDISKIISDARTAAADNYRNSISLEQQYRPGTAALRVTTDTALGNLAAGNTSGAQATQTLLQSIGAPVGDTTIGSNPLLEESSARILNNLRLGGALGPDVQAQAMKGALEKAGAAGISGSGAARGLVARDLGLTSLGLENQRIGQAQEAGTRQAQIGLSAQQLKLQDFLGRASFATNAAAQDAQRVGLLASIVDSRALPESGLNPGSIASLYVGQNNADNQVNATNAMIGQQQRNQNFNALLGLGSAAASGGNDAFAGLFKTYRGNPVDNGSYLS